MLLGIFSRRFLVKHPEKENKKAAKPMKNNENEKNISGKLKIIKESEAGRENLSDGFRKIESWGLERNDLASDVF